jgi:2-iminobutanoate/2-iminopropanoate deaminase
MMIEEKDAFRMREIEKEWAFCQAVRAGDLLFIAGTVSWDADANPLNLGDMTEQMRFIYGDIATTLKHYGLGPADIVKENLFCTDMEKFNEAFHVRVDFYKGVVSPATGTAVQVSSLIKPGLMLEIEMIAYFSK